MSCKRKIQAWKEVSVKVDALNQENIAQIENSVKECILQKLSKLDTILKNVNTYYYHGNIFINDRYGVLRDLEQIITAFGMNIKKIDCSLKGKNYIVSDELFEIARLLKIDDILIIQDDLDEEFGKYKLKKNSSSGGHNGLKNIEQNLGSKDYKRLKIGISNDKGIDTKNYVLGKFNHEERKIIDDIILTSTNIIDDFNLLTFNHLMTKYNKKV